MVKVYRLSLLVKTKEALQDYLTKYNALPIDDTGLTKKEQKHMDNMREWSVNAVGELEDANIHGGENKFELQFTINEIKTMIVFLDLAVSLNKTTLSAKELLMILNMKIDTGNAWERTISE